MERQIVDITVINRASLEKLGYSEDDIKEEEKSNIEICTLGKA